MTEAPSARRAIAPVSAASAATRVIARGSAGPEPRRLTRLNAVPALGEHPGYLAADHARPDDQD